MPENTLSPSPNNDTKPIYILGTNALACYLGAKFMDAGERVIILDSRRENHNLSTNGISLKEDYSLKKSHYIYETSFWSKEEGKMLIITAPSSEINSAITAVSPDKFSLSPIICFTLLKDTAYLKDILGSSFAKAHFSGWLKRNEQNIILADHAPIIKFYSPLDDELRQQISLLFSSANLKTEFTNGESSAFWNYFAVFALGSLVTAAYNQNLAQILKNKDALEYLRLLISEIYLLAKTDNVELEPDNILQQIYNIPSGYIFPLHEETKNGGNSGFNMLSSTITQSARRGNIKIPELSQLINKIYNIYLSIT